MTPHPAACPTPEALDRAFHDGDSGTARHAADCPRCAPVWASLEDLRDTAAILRADEPAPATHTMLRARLLEAAGEPAPRRAPVIAWAAAALMLAGLGALFAWQLSSSRDPATPPAPTVPAPEYRATVHTFDGTILTRIGEQPDEIVRLREGTVTVECDPLGEGERFRVVVGDAEVEVRGTAFDVTAEDDHLVSVYVLHGVVEVRATGQDPVLLRASERWDRSTALATPVPAPLVVPDATIIAGDVRAHGEAVAGAVTAPTDPAPRPSERERERRIEPEPTPVPHPEPALAPAPLVDPAEEAFAAGWSALEAGRDEEAVERFADVRRLDRNHALTEDADFWEMVALERSGRRHAAIRAAERFIDSWPDSSRRDEAAVLLGGWLFEAGDRDGAAEAYRLAADASDPRLRQAARDGLTAIGATRSRLPEGDYGVTAPGIRPNS